METTRQTEPGIGSEAWWAGIEAHAEAYAGYPEVQRSIYAEAHTTSQEAHARRQAACEPAGTFAMVGATA